jgi:hypothetical protein
MNPIDEPTPLLDRRRFTELLPWYVNGTLNAEDKAWLQAYLLTNPNAQGELAWMKSLQKQVQHGRAEFEVEMSLARVLKRIKNEAEGQAQPAWYERLLSKLKQDISPKWAYAAAAVIIAQSAALLHYHHELATNYSVYRTTPTPAADVNQALLRVNFRVETREEDIRLALSGIEGVIVAGPGRLGDYYVRAGLPVDQALDLLSKAKGVEKVLQVQQLPSRE